MLDSIDLPRLNLENPEKFLGLLVNKELKENWALHIGTDRQKLRKLLKKSPAEIFYFDSDKTHNGKMYLYNTVKKYRDNYLMIFDDVEDNLFWFDKKIKLEQRVLINYQNKYIGIMYTINLKINFRCYMNKNILFYFFFKEVQKINFLKYLNYLKRK